VSNEELDLTGRLTEAISSYEARWKTVDKELYDLCHRRPSLDDFADVYTKVAIIGRVYEAGVARAWRGKGDPESEITHVLIEQADLIQKGLQRLENRSFDQQAAADIVELHGHVARAISHRTAGVFLASFVSKYLHGYKRKNPPLRPRMSPARRAVICRRDGRASYPPLWGSAASGRPTARLRAADGKPNPRLSSLPTAYLRNCEVHDS